jgi:hypothetical protein
MPKKQPTAAKRARAAARTGGKYTTELRAGQAATTSYVPAPEAARTFPGDGGPAVSSWDGNPHYDVNAACGHHLRALCGGCGVCTTCDGCYCAELAEEAAIDAEYERAYDAHLGHDDHRDGCYLCEDARKESVGYTRCPKCELAYPDGRPDHITHNPPYCLPLPRYRVGIDWSYLVGQHATFVGRDYSVHGLVLAGPRDDANPAYPHLRIRRTDPGYEDGPDESSPVNPREWLEVIPAPPGHTAR